MPWLELLRAIVATLWVNRLRAGLTLLGVMTGVGTLVMLASVVGGGLAAVGRTVQEASGADLLRARVDRLTLAGRQEPPLEAGDVRAIAGASGLERATVLPQRVTRVDLPLPGGTLRGWAVGTAPEAPGVYQLELAQGRFLLPQDLEDRARVVVVGPDVADRLRAAHGLAGVLGAEVRLWGTRLRVVGELRRKPSLKVDNLSWNNAVAMPEPTFVLLHGARDLETILVKTNHGEGVAKALPVAEQAIRAVLAGRSHGPDAIRVMGGGPSTSGERNFLAALEYLLVGVAVICLVAGGVNLMNIMLVTVTERTREIGLRMALGARRVDIRRQFLGEALALSAVGGVAGLAVGLVASWLVSEVLTRLLGYWPWVVQPEVLALGFASALITGVAFGWYPAERASRMPPIDCLRSD
jgi:putative ABC transport system permease protein